MPLFSLVEYIAYILIIDLYDPEELFTASDPAVDGEEVGNYDPIPSSPLDLNHDNTEPDETGDAELVTNSDLEAIGCVVNTRGHFLICLGCDQAVLPSIYPGHGHSQHNMDPFDIAVLDKLVSEFDLFKTATDFHNHLATLNNIVAFDGLDVVHAYRCPKCRHGATTSGSMKSHWSRKHKGLRRPRLPVGSVQRIYLSPQYNRWVPVQDKLNSTQAQDSMTAWINAYAQLPVITPPPTSTNEPPPWLQKLGWLKFVATINPQKMAEFLDKLRNDWVFKSLSDALVEYLRHAMIVLVTMPIPARQVLRSITE